jgi:hypothetical protein
MRLLLTALAAGILAACAASPSLAGKPEPVSGQEQRARADAHGAAARRVTPREISRIEDHLADADGAFADARHHVPRRQEECSARAPYDATEAIIRAETHLVRLDDAIYDRRVEAREDGQDRVAARLREAFALTTGLQRAAERLRTHIWDPCRSYDPSDARETWHHHLRDLRDLLRDLRDDLR